MGKGMRRAWPTHKPPKGAPKQGQRTQVLREGWTSTQGRTDMGPHGGRAVARLALGFAGSLAQPHAAVTYSGDQASLPPLLCPTHCFPSQSAGSQQEKGYGLLNILLRSTFSLQYGHVCFFPTMHQPRMQNS